MPTLRVIMIRHGHREANEDAITAEGAARARALGASLRTQFAGIEPLGLCSEKTRARQTLMAILAGMGIEEPPALREERALQNAVSPAFDEAWARLEAIAPDAGVEMYLKYGRQRPDPETLSPREVAERVAAVIRRYLFPTSQMGRATDSVVLMITHSGIIELFLATVLNFGDVAEMGGILGYLEPVHLVVEMSADAPGMEAESSVISISFRDREYLLDKQAQRWLVDQEG